MFPKTTAELVKNTSTVSPTTLPTVKDALDTLNAASPGTVLTTRGDLLTRNASALARLPIGSSGTVLRSDGTDPAWATVATMLSSLLTARGQIIRRGASAPEALAAQTADTFLGGDGTDVTTRTAAQVRTSLGIEFGTFTPAVTFATPGDLSVTYGEQTGWYTKLPSARYVIGVRLNFTPTYTTASGNLRVTGLPSIGNGSWQLGQAENSSNITYPASRTALLAWVVSSQTYCQVQGVGSALNASQVTATNLVSGVATILNFSGPYLGV